MRRMIFALVLLLLIPLTGFALADYQSVETSNFRVWYRNGWEKDALNVLNTMEFYKPYVEDLTGNRVGQTTMIIEDMGNEVNGYMDPFGERIALFAYPPTADELSNGEDWWQLVGVHEYIHRAQMTTISGAPKLLRSVLGNVLYPGIHQPNWVTEGITVYGESNLNPFTGRMRGGYYNNAITALAKEYKLPSPAKATVFSKDTPLAHFYVFGGSFLSYLGETYGKDKFRELFALQGGSLRSYLGAVFPSVAIDRYFHQVYGKPLKTLWRDWQTREAEREIELPRERLSSVPGSYSLLRRDGSGISYARATRSATGPFCTFGENSIVRAGIADGKLTEQVILNQATDFPAGYQIVDEQLYYTRSEYRAGFANNENGGRGAITELRCKDLGSEQDRLITKGDIRSFCLLPGGELILAQDIENYHGTRLDIYSPSGVFLREAGKLDALVGNIIPDQGRLFVTLKKSWESTGVYELTLDPVMTTPIADTPYAEKLTGAADGYLFFDASYNDRQSSFAYHLSDAKTFRLCAYDGTRSTTLAADGKLYTIGMHAAGEDIYTAVPALSEYRLPDVPGTTPPPAITYRDGAPLIAGKIPVKKSGYSGNLLRLFNPRILHLPFALGTPDSLNIGIMLIGRDVVGDFPLWTAQLQYDLKTGKPGAILGLSNSFLHPVNQELSYSTLDGGSLSLDQYVTLLDRRNYGVNRLWTGFSFIGSEGFDRRIWNAYTGMNFSWHGGKLGTNQALFLESRDFLPSDRDRLGLHCRINLSQRLSRQTQFRGSIHYAHDPSADADEVFSTMRGYDTRWEETIGCTLRNNIDFPLFHVREGIWTPQLFFEDVYGAVFFDASIPRDIDGDSLRYAGGLEISSELSLASIISLELGFRVGINRDGEIKPSLILGSGF